MLLIGAPYSAADDSHNSVVKSSGAVYAFSLEDNDWILNTKLAAIDAESGALFGASMSFYADRVWIAASAASAHGVVRSGAVYSIEVENMLSENGSVNGQHISVASIIILLLILPVGAILCYFVWWKESSKELELHTPLDIEKMSNAEPHSAEMEAAPQKPYEVSRTYYYNTFYFQEAYFSKYKDIVLYCTLFSFLEPFHVQDQEVIP